ncbi:L,D-transpeptidase family protein [Nonomuraea solani]|uniref:L,D-transpeptidase family protein n=1 Tax=Nonomuraea solani TaxID=1144553 RepID=UPI000CDE9BCB|nr:L,D-transpeptidase family protein [Nonomuraea solani]
MAALLTAGAVVVSGCGTETAPRSHASLPAAPVPEATGSASQAVPAATVIAPRKTLRLGAKGKAVTWMQERLRELGYRPGKPDGRYGGTTLAAVWAFQKVNGIRPTSTIAKRTWAALEAPKSPKVLVGNGKPTRAEVNLTKQIMVLYVDGQVKLITHVSSGSGVPYCETATWQGKKQRFCGSATTPTGNFKTTWRASGWHKSYLGQLYNPIFFNGGIAFHGALSVPLYPASHGCVRMPMNVSVELPGLLGKGVPVHVKGRFQRS